jgi:hypothetical protein
MKKKVKKKKPVVPKPEQATLLGYKIVNECTCGEKVELYDRQEMSFSGDKQQWYRLCETCIEKKIKTKKPSLVPKGTLPSKPPLRPVLEIRP